ncbi:MAG: hypothetical protein GX638_17435 [Crenarchaeota archaeon]|nr:hypothetical protein [Thermoproteota archaeon]
MAIKDQKVTHDGNQITIFRSSFKRLASATFDEELFKKIASVTWSVSRSETGKEYLKSTKYGLLHQLVYSHFFGQNALDEAYEKGFVIDHLDNNGYECIRENLALIPKRENTAKGLTLDIERNETIDWFALNITCDFETREFQITVIFNQIFISVINNDKIPLQALYFRYGTDFKTVLIDARAIINDLNTSKMLNFNNLRLISYVYEKAEVVIATLEEIESGILMKEGKPCFIQGSPKHKFIKFPHNKELHR